MRLTCCTELLHREGFAFEDQCRFAKAVGYQALELAVECLPGNPMTVSMAEIHKLREIARWNGLEIAGLHWLLSDAPSLSITDPSRSRETEVYLLRLVEICAELGGRVLVHGSPRQRAPLAGMSAQDTLAHVAALFRNVADAAARHGLVYAIEPLSSDQTPFINTLDEAQELVDMIGSDHFRTMLDCSSAALAEEESVPDLARRWLPTGRIAHIHLNDSNRGAPGTGHDDFSAIIAAIVETGYDGDLSVEPFTTCVNAQTTLAIAAATVKAHLQTFERGTP